MKKAVVILLCFVLLLSGCMAGQPTDEPKQNTVEQSGEQNTENEQSKEQSTGVDITCMSVNVLAWAPDSWGFEPATERSVAVTAFLKEQKCDIFGLQEVTDETGFTWVAKEDTFDWKTCIRKALGDEYGSCHVNEEENGTFFDQDIRAGLMIMWRKDRFEYLESGGGEYVSDRAHYQWVRLRDKQNDKDVLVTNTHLSIDYLMSDGVTRDLVQGNRLRSEEAEELAQLWEDSVGDGALFATGDYNCKDYDEPHLNYLQKSGRFFPSYALAEEIEGHDTIDMVYINSANTDCKRYELYPREYTFKDGSTISMSDHRAVITYAVVK